MIRVCAICDYRHEEPEQMLLFSGIAGRRPRPSDDYCPRCDMPWRLQPTGMQCPMCGAPAIAAPDSETAMCSEFLGISLGSRATTDRAVVLAQREIRHLGPRRPGEPRRFLIRGCSWAGPCDALLEHTDPEGIRPSLAAE